MYTEWETAGIMKLELHSLPPPRVSQCVQWNLMTQRFPSFWINIFIGFQKNPATPRAQKHLGKILALFSQTISCVNYQARNLHNKACPSARDWLFVCHLFRADTDKTEQKRKISYSLRRECHYSSKEGKEYGILSQQMHHTKMDTLSEEQFIQENILYISAAPKVQHHYRSSGTMNPMQPRQRSGFSQ